MDNKYDETIEVISNMAKVKMTMNAHKGEIENLPTLVISAAMKDEVAELESALLEENLMHIIEEAADVMNFLVAVTHQQIKKYRARKPSHVGINKVILKGTLCNCEGDNADEPLPRNHQLGSKGCIYYREPK
ncbi:hypothetical protein KAR91_48035 [Candidatus Pacearchaeota archaeon]|nr:hypothetical protein [Candidatus Pacearchaeota archaeon]